MSQIRIPNQGKFSQPNKGDVFGNLKSTLNVDLRTNPGRLRNSPRMTVLTKDNDASIANMVLPIVFSPHLLSGSQEVILAATGGGGYGSAGTGKILTSNLTAATALGAFANLSGGAATSQPTKINDAFSDMVSWAGKETNTVKRTYVSTYSGSSHDIAQLESSTWIATWLTGTRSFSGLINGAPVNMCSAFNGLLYIAQEFQLMYAPIATDTIVSPSSATDPNTTQGTIHTLAKYVITWVQSSSNRLWVGLIEATNGSRFSHNGGYVAEWDGTGTAFNKIYKINAPCALSCTIVNDIPYIIDGYGVLRKFNGVGFGEVGRLPVANSNTEMPGIYDMYNNSRWIHTRGMTNDNNLILINVNNLISTGKYVEDMPSGVWEFDTANPEQGIYHRNSPCVDSNDYGQQYIQAAGAIYPLKIVSGNYLAGESYYSDDTTTQRYGIFYDDVATNTNKKSSFTTPFISSSQIKDTWKKAYYRHTPIITGDKIIGKYRSFKNSNFPFNASITWISATTFTSSDANFANVNGGISGEEVEITMGKGASSTAHVVSISVNAGTYTITLDDTIGFSSGTARARIDNFIKMSSISTIGEADGQMNFGKIGVTSKTTKVQVKTEIQATGNFDMEDITIASDAYETAQ